MITSATPHRLHTPLSLLAAAFRSLGLEIRFRIAAAKIHKAIADGEITEGEGAERLGALRERLAARRDQGGL